MNALTQTALSWLSLGVSPIPIVYRSKIPAVEWKMWQSRLPPKKVINYWFENGDNNIGVVCGGKSNLAIIDFDDINSYYDWRKDMIKRDDEWKYIATKSYRVRTNRGMHIYLKTKEPEQSRKYPDTKIDVRCTGNYTLVPPSIHPSGTKYEPLGTINDIITINDTYGVFKPEIGHSLCTKNMDLNHDCNNGIFDIGMQANTISNIKSSINILQFVSQLTQISKGSSDGRWWWARCINPSHKDRNPSMRIDAKTGRVKCMNASCRLYHAIGYDIIDVYSILYNLDTKQSIRELSEIYLV